MAGLVVLRIALCRLRPPDRARLGLRARVCGRPCSAAAESRECAERLERAKTRAAHGARNAKCAVSVTVTVSVFDAGVKRGPCVADV